MSISFAIFIRHLWGRCVVQLYTERNTARLENFMEILILGRGISAKSIYNALKDNNNITFALEDHEELDNISIYKIT